MGDIIYEDSIEFKKVKAGAEDLLLNGDSPITVNQDRGTVVPVTKINSKTIPTKGEYGKTGFESVQDALDSKANKNGSVTQQFKVHNGYDPKDAVNKEQLDKAILDATSTIISDTLTSTSTTEALSANQGKVLNDTKASKAGDASQAFKVKDATAYYEAVSLGQVKNYNKSYIQLDETTSPKLSTLNIQGNNPSAKLFEDGTIVGGSSYGHFEMQPNGKLTCWYAVSERIAIDTAYGNLYQGSKRINYAKHFAYGVATSIGLARWDTSASWGTVAEQHNNYFTLRVLDINSRDTSSSTLVSFVAVGMWK